MIKYLQGLRDSQTRHWRKKGERGKRKNYIYIYTYIYIFYIYLFIHTSDVWVLHQERK